MFKKMDFSIGISCTSGHYKLISKCIQNIHYVFGKRLSGQCSLWRHKDLIAQIPCKPGWVVCVCASRQPIWIRSQNTRTPQSKQQKEPVSQSRWKERTLHLKMSSNGVLCYTRAHTHRHTHTGTLRHTHTHTGRVTHIIHAHTQKKQTEVFN